MGRIPEDAIHWDSGDWIEWHRAASNLDERPCVAATADEVARLTAMHVSLLRSARTYYELTSRHLPVYQVLAQVFAAICYDLALSDLEGGCETSGLEVLHIPPHGPHNRVTVDLDRPFKTLIVVRIKDNFTCDARMMDRAELPQTSADPYTISWQDLPQSV